MCNFSRLEITLNLWISFPNFQLQHWEGFSWVYSVEIALLKVCLWHLSDGWMIKLYYLYKDIISNIWKYPITLLCLYKYFVVPRKQLRKPGYRVKITIETMGTFATSCTLLFSAGGVTQWKSVCFGFHEIRVLFPAEREGLGKREKVRERERWGKVRGGGERERKKGGKRVCVIKLRYNICQLILF